MQYFKIRLNNRFDSPTGITDIDYLVFSDYYVHENNNLGGGIVNPDNVRVFLNDNRTQTIVKEFIVFLSGSTSESEIVEILGSDAKLSETFNDFYTNVMTTGYSDTDIIDNQLTGTTTITYLDNYFNWNGHAYPKALDYIPLEIYAASRNSQYKNKIISYNSEDSYSIAININRHVQETDRNIFQLCVEKIIGNTNYELEIDVTERSGAERIDIIESDEINNLTGNSNFR